MNLLNISTTGIDLNAQVAPFVPNNTVLAYSAAGATLQESADDSSYATLATLVAGVFQKVTLELQYIKVASGSAQLIGN